LAASTVIASRTRLVWGAARRRADKIARRQGTTPPDESRGPIALIPGFETGAWILLNRLNVELLKGFQGRRR